MFSDEFAGCPFRERPVPCDAAWIEEDVLLAYGLLGALDPEIFPPSW